MMLSPGLRKLNGGVVSLTPTRSFPRKLIMSSESARGDDTITAEIAAANPSFFQQRILLSVNDATYSLAADCQCAAWAILAQSIRYDRGGIIAPRPRYSA